MNNGKVNQNQTTGTATKNSNKALYSEVISEITTLVEREKPLKQAKVETIISYNNVDGTNFLVLVGEKVEESLEFDSLHTLTSGAEARIIGDKTLASFFEAKNPTVIQPIKAGKAIFDRGSFMKLQLQAIKVQQQLVSWLIHDNADIEEDNIEMVLGYHDNQKINYLVSVSDSEEYQGDHYSIDTLGSDTKVTVIGSTTMENFVKDLNPLVVAPIENSFAVYKRNDLQTLRRKVLEAQALQTEAVPV